MPPQSARRSPARPAGRPASAAAPADPASTPFYVAAAVLVVETVALVAVALVVVSYLLAGHHSYNVRDAWFLVCIAVAGALAAGVVAVGFWRRRRWSRAPAVLIQLLALPLGVNAAGNGVWWLAGPLLVGGVAGLIGLFAPTTTRMLFGTPPTR